MSNTENPLLPNHHTINQLPPHLSPHHLTRKPTIHLPTPPIIPPHTAPPARIPLLPTISERNRIAIHVPGRRNEHIGQLAIDVDALPAGRLDDGGPAEGLADGVLERDGEAVARGVGAGAFVALELLQVHAALAGYEALFVRGGEGAGGEGQGGEEGGGGELHLGLVCFEDFLVDLCVDWFDGLVLVIVGGGSDLIRSSWLLSALVNCQRGGEGIYIVLRL